MVLFLHWSKYDRSFLCNDNDDDNNNNNNNNDDNDNNDNNNDNNNNIDRDIYPNASSGCMYKSS